MDVSEVSTSCMPWRSGLNSVRNAFASKLRGCRTSSCTGSRNAVPWLYDAQLNLQPNRRVLQGNEDTALGEWLGQLHFSCITLPTANWSNSLMVLSGFHAIETRSLNCDEPVKRHLPTPKQMRILRQDFERTHLWHSQCGPFSGHDRCLPHWCQFADIVELDLF